MKKKLLKIFILIPFLGFTQTSSVYITNEGNFGTGNGSLSIYDRVTNISTNDVYSNANGGILLGDVVQSIEQINENLYISVNNSSKIEVIDANANYIGTIPVNSPRYLKQVAPSKAYASDWGINGVQVIDLNNNTVTSTISCGTGPEGIAISNNFAYVCNRGGWGLDSTVTIINTISDNVEMTVVVGDNPNSAVVDINNNVWILTGGYTEYDANWNVVSETAGVLAMINTTNNIIERSYTFPVGNHPSDLVINGTGDKLYYLDGSWNKSVYEFNLTDTSLSLTPLISRNFYALGFDPVLNEIYGSDAVDFTQNGWVFRYATTGTVIDSFQVGIIPGSFAFASSSVSTENFKNIEINLFPNPSSGYFEVKSQYKIKQLIIRDLVGNILKNIRVDDVSYLVDISQYRKGMYLANIITDKGINTKRIIIE